MKLTIDLRAMHALVTQMGAEPIAWKPDLKGLDNLDPFHIDPHRGRIISIDEVEFDLNLPILKWRDRQILLHIMSTNHTVDALKFVPEKCNRFHVAWCQTLKNMDDVGRLERYVATQRKDGTFIVEGLIDQWVTKREEVEAEIKVCMNCLKEIDYQGYLNATHQKKRQIWRDFNIMDFFEEFSSEFQRKPTYTDENAPRGGYSDNWDDISRRYRESVGWQCENTSCGVVLDDKPGWLHTHHINGVTGDNSWSNLRALCVWCHKEQPQHGHVIMPDGAAAEIARRRIARGAK